MSDEEYRRGVRNAKILAIIIISVAVAIAYWLSQTYGG